MRVARAPSHGARTWPKRGDLDRRARQLTNLGSASLALGDKLAARARFDDALNAARVIGLREIYVYALLGLASAWVTEDPSRAARLQGVSDALAQQLGTSAQTFEARVREETLETLRAASAEDAYLAAVAHGRALSPNDAVAYAVANVNHPGDGSVATGADSS